MNNDTCAVEVCDRTSTARTKWCRMHHRLALVHDGDPGTLPVRAHGRPVQERFWEKVNKTETCWLWTSWLSDQGYGGFYVSPRKKAVYAHRQAYEWLVGPISDDLELDHLCKVRHCLNPAHLEPVTPYVNKMRSDSPSAVNKRKTFCIEGHEFTPENTYRRPDNGNRQCRACNARRRAERAAVEAAARSATKAFSD